MSLTDALQTLANAHGPSALAGAFHALQGQVKRARRASRQQFGALAQTFTEAMRIWDAEKAEGVSKTERLARLERTLRAAWPRRRDEAWHYVCVACSDLGLEMFECDGGSTCGRGKPHLPHSYGRPCLCAKGTRYTEKPKADAADYKQAGFTKVGKR